MGQRHQLLVIAKINGKYRTLCAIHHQWLYGRTALSRCNGILKIFGDATNQRPIQQELRLASKKDEKLWVARPDEQETRKIGVPFPFIATCLSMGASFNLDDGYYHGVNIEPLHMQYDQGDNNNGITIFDISDTSDVRYCFVDFHGMESRREVPLMTPLSARTYLQAYYNLHEMPFWALLEKFEGVNLIATHALIDTWPDGEWGQLEPDFEGAVGSPDTSELKMSHLTPVDAPKPLRDQRMEKLLDVIFEASEDASQLVADAEDMIDFMPKLRHKFYAEAATLQPSPALLSLLCRVLEHETEIDLSPFKTLTTNDISAILAGLRKGRMETLDLSDMSHLQESDLEQILGLGNATPEKDSPQVESLSSAEDPGAIRGLKTLILLDNPQISLNFLAKHLGDCEVYPSALFRRSIGEGQWDSPVPSLEFLAPNIVSQLVWIGISESQCSNPTHRRDDGRFNWQTAIFEEGKPDHGEAQIIWFRAVSIGHTASNHQNDRGSYALAEVSINTEVKLVPELETSCGCMLRSCPYG